MPASTHYIRQRAPVATDDAIQGYFAGCTWEDEVAITLHRMDSHATGNAVWTDITPPSGGGGPVTWNSITGKPSTFPPNPLSETDIPILPIAKVNALEATLTAKAEAAAVQSQLDGKQAVLGFTAQDVAQKGQVNGYPSLDGTGKVPSAQLPSSAGPFVVVRKTSADQTNTTVNLANATTLLLPVAANQILIIEGFLRMRSSLATAGFKVAFDVPALAEITGGIYQPVSSAGAVSGALQRADALNVGATTGVDLVNQDVLVYGYWLLVNGANAGNAQLMFAAEVAATVTMRIGSTLRGMVV